MTTAPANSTPKFNAGRTLVILIGVFKLLKAALLILAAAAAIELTRQDVTDALRQWIANLTIGPFRRTIGDFIVAHVLGLSTDARRLYAFAVGATLYAILFLTEGVGLLFNKIWAEWLAVISTGGLIPLEIIETWHHRESWKTFVPGIVTFLVNVAIVIYLFRRVKARVKQHHAEHSALAVIPSEIPPAPPRPGAGSYAPDKSLPRSEV